MKHARLISVVLILSAATMNAAPRTFVSALTGNDANNCSRTAPCRNFAAAIPLTDVDGEVVVLDSGGYGAATISSGVSIIAPSGVFGGVAVFSGAGFTINASSFSRVLLKGLFLNNQTGDNGITLTSAQAGQVILDGCTVNGFQEGILFNPSNAGASLVVTNSIFRRNGLGIYVLNSASRAVVENVRLYNNAIGIEDDGAQVTMRKTAISGSQSYAVRNEQGKMSIEDSAFENSGFGLYNNNSAGMFVNRCVVSANNVGVKSQFTSGVWVSDSTIVANTTGLSATNSGSILSRCTDVTSVCPAGHFTNTLAGNGTDGAFTSSYTSN